MIYKLIHHLLSKTYNKVFDFLSNLIGACRIIFVECLYDKLLFNRTRICPS